MDSENLNLQTHKAVFTSPLYLTSGRILEPYEIVYETYGNLNATKSNAILVTHALTGSHHCAGKYAGDKKSGWWDKMVGSGKYIDTDKYFVICCSVIGSPFGSTSPITPTYGSFGNNDFYRFSFPLITIQDMVRSIKILLNYIGIESLHAIVGGSMGGMQTLCFAILYPRIAKMFIPIATSYASNPNIIAINKVMKEVIMLDPAFNGGNYEINGDYRFKGLQIARMLGFTQYISLDTMQNKFSRKYVLDDGHFDMFGRFEIERYLDYNGATFASLFDPLCYLYLIRAVSIYDASLGFDCLESALSQIQSPLHLIGFSGDNMFPIDEMRYIKECMDKLGKDSTLDIIDSNYGHDGFLVEIEKYGHIIKGLLD